MVNSYEWLTRLDSMELVLFFNMNCVFWNIRGLGKGEKSMSIRKLVEKKKVSFMGLVEIKHKRFIRIRVKRMWGNDEFDICEVYASDTSGGGVIILLHGTREPSVFLINILGVDGSC